MADIVFEDKEVPGKSFVSIGDVRISPPDLIFTDVFEFKTYSKQVSIQNCGRKAVLIRILGPTSSFFKIKTIPRGKYLSPGLKIVKNVSFIYEESSKVVQAFLPILVNDTQFHLKIMVEESSSSLIVSPNLINFGTVNVGESTALKSFVLKNDSKRAAQFVVDVRLEEFQVVVHPYKGNLASGKSITIEIQLVAMVAGDFERSLWIRCMSPTVVTLKCTCLTPEIVINHPKKTTSFVLIDFPYTYFGAPLEKFVILENKNAASAMFVVLSEWQEKVIRIDEAMEVDVHLKQFRVSQLEGVLLPYEGLVLGFKHVPFITEAFVKSGEHLSYHFTVLQIIRLDCQQVTPCKIMGDYNEAIGGGTIGSSFNSGRSDQSYEEPYALGDEGSGEPNFSVFLSSFVRIYLYGIAERPDVTTVPDALNLSDEIEINRKVYRIIRFCNHSTHLPIILRYGRVAYVQLQKEIYLKPREHREITIVIKPCAIGRRKDSLPFKLMYRPHAKSDIYTVGNLLVPITYTCVAAKTTKDGSDNSDYEKREPLTFPTKLPTFIKPTEQLVAYKSDTKFFVGEKEKRPWTVAIPIPALKPPPPLPTELARSLEMQPHRKKMYAEYYQKYLKRNPLKKGIPFHLTPSDYDLFALEDKCNKSKLPPLIKNFGRQKGNPTYLPLFPTQLYSVRVYPRKIFLGKIAQLSTISESVSIQNLNDFNIFIIVRPHDACMKFNDGNRKVVEANGNSKVTFNFMASRTEGFFEMRLDIIINDTNMYTVSVMGEIVKKTLVLSNTDFHFKENDTSTKYLDLHNPFTCSISFSFEIPKSCFDIMPTSGLVLPGKHIICIITFKPYKQLPRTAIYTLLVEGKLSQSVRFTAEKEALDVYFMQPVIDFGQIAINELCVRFATLKNAGSRPVQCVVTNHDPIPGIILYQPGRVIQNSSQMYIRINVQITVSGNFNVIVDVEIQRRKIVPLTIRGTVIFPEIIVRPNLLQFRSIPNHSFDRLIFWIDNQSPVCASIHFDLKHFHEFTITKSADPLDIAEDLKLAPKEARRMFMHYNPIHNIRHEFFLDVIVNDMVPEVDPYPSTTSFEQLEKEPSGRSSKASKMKMSRKSQKKSAGALPFVAPILVIGVVKAGGVTFNKTRFQFYYYPFVESGNVVSEILHITNLGKRVEEFCLRLDELDVQFELSCLDPDKVEMGNGKFSLSSVLHPDERRSFKIEFKPNKPGTYSWKLPVYVRNHMEGAVYKFIYFTGEYPSASLEVSTPIVYLEPVPLRTVSRKKINLTAKYHLMMCAFKVDVEDSDVKVECKDLALIDVRTAINMFGIFISFSAETPKVLESKVKVHCKCGAECVIVVKGCSENCGVTNHAFISVLYNKTKDIIKQKIIYNPSTKTDYECGLETLSRFDMSSIMEMSVNYNETTFPLFPMDNDQTDYAIHMRKTLVQIEKWLNTQGFYGSTWCAIPEGLTIDPFLQLYDTSQPGGSLERFPKNLPYIILLKNLAGPNFVRQIDIDPQSWTKSKVNAIKYLWLVYDGLKTLLMKMGACLPNIEAEYLFNYSQYEFYQNFILPYNNPYNKSTSLLSFRKFHRLSKQNWLDLLLQTYKVFQLQVEKVTLKANSARHPDQVLSYYARENLTSIGLFTDVQSASMYHPIESMLLCWLESVYFHCKYFFKDILLPERTITFFDVDLRDGIILAVATAAYCPYIMDEFKDFYWTIENDNQFFYNGCKLCMVWEKLRCNFKITPKEILEPNSLNMEMLVLNLFDFLPSMWPSEKMEFHTSLAFQCEKTVTISNENPFPLKFTTHFFQNELECFSVDKNELILAPYGTGSIEVIFFAKKLKVMEAYLLFGGESDGYHLARNRVYHLVGTPSVLSRAYMDMKIPSKSFKRNAICLDISSPYKVAAEYEIYMSYNEPAIHSMVLIKWNETKVRYRIPRRLKIVNEKFVVNDEGVGQLTLITASVWVQDYCCWVFFRNESLGDFYVKLSISVTMKPFQFVINIDIPKSFLANPCTCGSSRDPRCAKNVIVKYEAANPHAWNSLKEALMLALDDEMDRTFWSVHYKSYPGLAILRRIVDDMPFKSFFDFHPLYKPWIPFRIYLEDEKLYEYISHPHISYLHHMEYFIQEEVFHINTDKFPENFVFCLTSLYTKITRCYRTNFIPCGQEDDEKEINSEDNKK